MWTLIISIAILKTSGVATHTITVPNIPTRELCQVAGQEHTEKYTRQVNVIAKNMERINMERINSSVVVYTCVETK